MSCSTFDERSPATASPWRRVVVALLAVAMLAPGGCTSPREYIRNGYLVGPNYGRPPAPVAPSWIDANDRRVRTDCDDLAGWWTVFGDPILDGMIQTAYSQNLTLRQAGYRVLAARAQQAFALGNIFPQSQFAGGGFQHLGVGNVFSDLWTLNFNLAWELDFWGRFRRALYFADATLDASAADYDDVLVTLLSDVASNYVNYRTTQERIRLLTAIVEVQQGVVTILRQRLEVQAVSTLDLAQGVSNLKQSEAGLNSLQIQLRQYQNQLCILMGMPVEDLDQFLNPAGPHPIPIAPDFVVVGIPADLLRRRPDVRRAERQAAAQAEQIGIAVAQFYPAFAITGTLGWQATSFPALFNGNSLNSRVGPIFNWDLLNYGRIRANVAFQDATFRELVAAYQQSVLQADLEVENGIITFLESQERARNLGEAVDAATVALQVAVVNVQAGQRMALFDFNRYALLVQTLITQQDQWAQARGQIALGLIDTYRALGGGWQIKSGYVPDKRGVLSPDPGLVQPEAVQPGQPMLQPPAAGDLPAVDEPQPLPLPPSAGQ